MTRMTATRKSLLWIFAFGIVALLTMSDRGQARGPDSRQDPNAPQVQPDPGGPPPGGGGDGDADELGIYKAPPANDGTFGTPTTGGASPTGRTDRQSPIWTSWTARQALDVLLRSLRGGF
ncbi:MAG: hypothetical protein U0527_12920 [Candidatus Eisenbacteria bacterium]